MRAARLRRRPRVHESGTRLRNPKRHDLRWSMRLSGDPAGRRLLGEGGGRRGGLGGAQKTGFLSPQRPITLVMPLRVPPRLIASGTRLRNPKRHNIRCSARLSGRRVAALRLAPDGARGAPVRTAKRTNWLLGRRRASRLDRLSRRSAYLSRAEETLPTLLRRRRVKGVSGACGASGDGGVDVGELERVTAIARRRVQNRGRAGF
jgi:hypothetical protein